MISLILTLQVTLEGELQFTLKVQFWTNPLPHPPQAWTKHKWSLEPKNESPF